MQNDRSERKEERVQNDHGGREEVVEDECEEKLLSPKASESSSVGVEEGMVGRGTRKVLETAALENEFILDGFDFSTGTTGSMCTVIGRGGTNGSFTETTQPLALGKPTFASCPPPGLSICQELAADEEEDLELLQVDGNNPTEISTALMKALRVKEQLQEDNRECLVSACSLL